MNKQKLINNFSKNANTYDQYATVQKECANTLLALIPQNENTNILEIGCGTGVYTQLLDEKFVGSAIYSIDISADMIELAKKRFPRNNIHFIKSNIEDLKIEKKFDIVTSNVSLQWVSDLEKTIARISQLLTKKGVIAFSVYGPETFKELKKVLSTLYGKEKWLSSSFFNGKNEIMKILSGNFSSIDIFENNVEIIYPDIWEFFYSIKRTGTQGRGIGKHVKLTKNRIEQIENTYLEIYGKIKATHNIFFCKGIKK